MNDLALLLVDDDALLLSALVRALRGRVTVRTATSGERALELLRAGPNDYFAVVSDIHMPGMDGPTFLAAAARVAPRTRAILMSGRLETEALLRAINGPGVFRCLPKPIETSTLVATLEEAWNAFRAQSA